MSSRPLLPVFLLVSALAWAGPPAASYSVRLMLDEVAHTLIGAEEITYRNHSADTLDAVWLHAFPNAFADRFTEYARELEALGRFEFSLAPPSARGWMRITRAAADGATVAPHMHGTELELPLPSPLAPGDSVLLGLDFTTRLPRMPGWFGHKGNTFVLVHCFPQVAARTGRRWHADGCHVFGRSPSEFADYSVTITAPASLVIAASGTEVWTTQSEGRRKQMRVAWNVPDFALFLGSDYVVFADSFCGVRVELLCPSRGVSGWPGTMDCIRDMVEHLSAWYGPYPFAQLTVVQAGGAAAVDASYPGLVMVAQRSIPGTRVFEQALARQIALQWFACALGTDELEHPWLALGPAAHAEMRHMAARYGPTNLTDQPFIAALFPGLSATYFHRASYYVAASNGILCEDVLTCRDALGFSARHVSKPGLLLHAIEHEQGTPRFDSLMRSYISSTRARRPGPAEFEQYFPGTSARLAALDPADTLIPSRLSLRRVEFHPIIALPSFSTYQVFYGPYAWLDSYHGVQLQGWLMGRLFVDAGPLRGRHMWMLSETYATRLKDWHTSLSYSTPLEFITNRLRFMVGLDHSGVEAGARANLVYELGPVFRPPQAFIEMGYRFLSLYDLRLRDPRAWDSAAFSDLRTRLTHTYERRNFKGSQRLYLARGLTELGGDFDYWKASIEQVHTFRWRMNSGVTLRFFAGTIQGSVPAQEQFYLSGGLTATPDEPVSWGYKDRTSGQERWHYDADANIRGFAGEYTHGRHAWGLNLYLTPVRFVQPFFDMGNTGDSMAVLLPQPKMDAGVRLRLGPLYADFPLWRYDRKHRFAFRWMVGLKVSETAAGL